MKTRRTWLQTAIRAHQAQTFDHMQRARHAWDELYEAEQLAKRSAQDLSALGESWANQRRLAISGAELESVYQRFHGFLQHNTAQADQAQQARQMHADAVEMDLRRSHAMQSTLEKVAQRAAEKRRRESRAKETQDAAESWLLGRVSRPPAVPRARTGDATTATPGAPATAQGTSTAHRFDIDGDSPRTHPQVGSDDPDTRQ